MVQTNNCLDLCFEQIKEYEHWIEDQNSKIKKNRREYDFLKLSVTNPIELTKNVIDKRHQLDKRLVWLISDLQKVKSQLSVLKQITAKTKCWEI